MKHFLIILVVTSGLISVSCEKSLCIDSCKSFFNACVNQLGVEKQDKCLESFNTCMEACQK